MDYKIGKAKFDTLKTDCLVIAVNSKGKLSEPIKALDQSLDGVLQKSIAQADHPTAAGSCLLLPVTGNDKIKRVLLVGTGDDAEISAATFRKCVQAFTNTLKTTTAAKIAVYLDEFAVADRDSQWLVKCLVETVSDNSYTFNQFKSKASTEGKTAPKLKSITILTATSADSLDTALSIGQAVAEGVSYTKDLGNIPGNVCTPTYLAKEAKALAKTYDHIKTTIIEEKEMKSLGMGALLAVSAGSAEPAKLIIMEYKGTKASSKPHVLVGKGITFDTGGISLKPGEAMDEMKYDMCGAASVLGAMKAIAQIQPELNIIGVITSAENMPGSAATRPGDIVTTMSGQTVEILNTDAEGRLVLCDALTYVEKFNPASVVDIATLTGACIIALGHHATGLLTNNESLADEILVAGEHTLDRAWRLPLWDEYQSQLDSNFADMQNIGGRPAGSVTAACFLSRFTKKYPWAHLDIAGTAWVSGKAKGATGRPVPLLLEYLLNKR
ncbi:MAG: leucyl aminopeptidase [Hahellaceae bacterium]|jgi:leucyl aminopeptidase|nr:leucyl aminopeptidase [Hahellaceae bacterium]MCP5213228.1 leucyl aminopeptidase [Hahellaceae bacterium]